MVLSPLIAATATFALKAAEWFRRGRLMDCSSSLAVSSTSSEQTHHLAACPINRNHLSDRPFASGTKMDERSARDLDALMSSKWIVDAHKRWKRNAHVIPQICQLLVAKNIKGLKLLTDLECSS